MDASITNSSYKKTKYYHELRVNHNNKIFSFDRIFLLLFLSTVRPKRRNGKEMGEKTITTIIAKPIPQPNPLAKHQPPLDDGHVFACGSVRLAMGSYIELHSCVTKGTKKD